MKASCWCPLFDVVEPVAAVVPLPVPLPANVPSCGCVCTGRLAAARACVSADPTLPNTVADTPRPAVVSRPAAVAPMSSKPASVRPRRSGKNNWRLASQSACAFAPFAVFNVILENCHRYSNSA